MNNQYIQRYLRLNESSVVMNSESSDADNFDFKVDRGCFSSADDHDSNKKKEEDNIQDAFLLQLQDGIEKNLIKGMKISKEQKMRLQEQKQWGPPSFFKTDSSAQRLITEDFSDHAVVVSSP